MAKVLVVDDEESIRFTFRKFLGDAGFEIYLAADENDARTILSTHEFDAAVVDHVLSNWRGGIDILKEIKSSQPFCEVIMISGSPTFKTALKTVDFEPFASLAKPIRKDAICRVVADAAEKSKKNRLHEESLKHRMDFSGH